VKFRSNDDIRRAVCDATAKIGESVWLVTAWTAKKSWQGTKRTAAFWGRRHPLLKAVTYVGGAVLTTASTTYAATKSTAEAVTAGGGVVAAAGLLMGINKFCSWAANDEKRRKDAQAS